MKKIIIIGASGYGKELAWVIDRMNHAGCELGLIGFCDDALNKQAGSFAGFPLLGRLEDAAAQLPGARFICAIGNNCARQTVVARAEAAGLLPHSIIDPTAIIAPDTTIGKGSFIGMGSIVSTGAVIGSHTIVNHQACVGHDVTIADFVQVCPGARISGGCHIGEGALLGTNAATIPLITMGAWSTLGAGTTAYTDLSPMATVIRIRGEPR
jgi:sugar O-acyltransferase (sialic acid O-acetyltransferase NeuD family)